MRDLMLADAASQNSLPQPETFFALAAIFLLDPVDLLRVRGRHARYSTLAASSDGKAIAPALWRSMESTHGNGEAMDMSLTVTGTAKDMHSVVRDEVYRIAYEAIRNACTHSAGRSVKVDVAADSGQVPHDRQAERRDRSALPAGFRAL
jgi:hypothetical protein